MNRPTDSTDRAAIVMPDGTVRDFGTANHADRIAAVAVVEYGTETREDATMNATREYGHAAALLAIFDRVAASNDTRNVIPNRTGLCLATAGAFGACILLDGHNSAANNGGVFSIWHRDGAGQSFAVSLTAWPDGAHRHFFMQSFYTERCVCDCGRTSDTYGRETDANGYEIVRRHGATG